MSSIKIKIAVAINEFGQWAAFGGNEYAEDVMKREVLANITDHCPINCYFVEVAIPIPTSEIIQGKITGN